MIRETVTFTFSGRLEVQSFAEFAQHRARRLALGLDLLSQGPGAATMRVTGQPDLVDAFEMALSLGPADCLVLEVERSGGETDRRTAE